MRPIHPRTGPHVAAGLLAALLTAVSLPAAAASPEAIEPTAGPDAMVGRFTGGPKGIVVALGQADDTIALRGAFVGLVPGATYRLILATASCGQPATDPVVVASFASFGVSDERYLARDITALLPAGLDSRVSARLRKVPGGAVGCANTTLYAYGPSGSPAGDFEKVAAFRAPETKGIALVRGIDEDSVRVQAVILDTEPGERHKLVGSSETCTKGHGSTDTVLRTRATEWVNTRLDDVANLGLLESMRVFRGSGYANQTACGVLIALLVP